MKRDVRIERTYDHSPEQVWRALTDPAALAEWLMANDFQPKLGHRFKFRDKPRGGWDGIVYCEVIELEENRRIAYRWCGNAFGKESFLDTVVTWTLEPMGEKTRLVLEHTGFRGFKATMLSFMLGAGWKKMLRGKFVDAIGRVVAGKYQSSGVAAACH
jgi:uncharacterized protein YndB with AHSA1/START domain